MAELRVDGNQLVVHLHAVEKAEGFHGDIVATQDDASAATDRIRAALPRR